MRKYLVPVSALLAALLIAVLASRLAVMAQQPSVNLAVEKSVDNPRPTDPSQTVEFKVTVRNTSNVTATAVRVNDALPPELKLPEFMTPSASVGTYDIDKGVWDIGEIAAESSETLVIPVVYAVRERPNCVVNRAELGIDDTLWSYDDDLAALYANGTERCVDLYIGVRPETDELNPCSNDGKIRYHIRVGNYGPDDARGVLLTLAQTDSTISGFGFSSEGCSRYQCDLGSIAARESVTVVAESRKFKKTVSFVHAIALKVTTTDEDYNPERNTLSVSHRFGPFTGICVDEGLPGAIGAGGDGCFIATAAYGSPLHGHVQTLRNFRDRWLSTNRPGRALMKVYYRYSPPVARVIGDSPAWRAALRVLLWPVVAMISHPLLSLLFSLVGSIVLVRVCRGHALG